MMNSYDLSKFTDLPTPGVFAGGFYVSLLKAPGCWNVLGVLSVEPKIF